MKNFNKFTGSRTGRFTKTRPLPENFDKTRKLNSAIQMNFAEIERRVIARVVIPRIRRCPLLRSIYGHLLLFLVVLLTGCTELQEHVELQRLADRIVAEQSTNEMMIRVSRGQLTIGMNKAEVHSTLRRTPWDVNKTIGIWGVHEQLVYYDGVDTAYLYFENGILTSWQTGHRR